MRQVPPKNLDKPTSAQDFFATRRYNDNSPEQRTKEEGIAQWIGRTGLPAQIVEDEEFITMMANMDKNFKVPKRHTILNFIDKKYKEEIKQNLATAQGWIFGLKRGLQHPSWESAPVTSTLRTKKAEHKLLNLKKMVHPHTAESISTLVEVCI